MSLNLWLKWIPVIITETQITYIRANKYITSMSLLKQQATMLVHSLFSHLSCSTADAAAQKLPIRQRQKETLEKVEKNKHGLTRTFEQNFFLFDQKLVPFVFNVFCISAARVNEGGLVRLFEPISSG